MLSGFKNLYSKSVDLIKQVQDQVVVKSQPGAAVPNIAPEKTHPGFHLVDRFHLIHCTYAAGAALSC